MAGAINSLLSRLKGPAAIRVDRKAFVIAAVLTPFLFALSGVILLGYGFFVTASAAVLGLPALVLLGYPIAWLVISRLPGSDGKAPLGGLCLGSLVALAFAWLPGVVILWLTDTS